MLGITLIIMEIVAIVALVSITIVTIRKIKINKKWKVIEPEMVKGIEDLIEQKIVQRILLNANGSMDKSEAKDFFVWIAFTSDYIAIAHKGYMVRNGEGDIYFAKRANASMKILKNRFVELEFRDYKSKEELKLVVLTRPNDIEVLSAFIPNHC